MITPENFADALRVMGFVKSGNSYEKDFPAFGTSLKADLKAQKLIYPDQIKGRDRNDFYDESHKENLVVFECVNRLLEKGYRPEHIELEKEWHLGHDAKSGRADICVTNADGKMLFIIECKTAGKEYKKAFDDTKSDGGQLFSYWQQEKSCEWLILYASDYENGNITYTTESIDCRDDKNIINSAKKDSTIKLYQNAHAVEELFDV
ncbi:MAG: type I restriction enzyme HsdR N-terminal domain-containing protein, partial [Schwartzia sp.]|nr:type I restriction enzyme HsdR N-terminal domain-containing protein [Schwartzia sp. (in: firmicutes)]